MAIRTYKSATQRPFNRIDELLVQNMAQTMRYQSSMAFGSLLRTAFNPTPYRSPFLSRPTGFISLRPPLHYHPPLRDFVFPLANVLRCFVHRTFSARLPFVIIQPHSFLLNRRERLRLFISFRYRSMDSCASIRR